MIDNIKSSFTTGLLANIPPSLVPLGTNSGNASKSITPSVGRTIVAETTESGGIWAAVGKAASAVGATQLINQYVGGKILKEQINDGIPVYTTTGNPNDQAGGKLLSSVSADQANVTRQYYLIAGGIVAVLAGLYIITRK